MSSFLNFLVCLTLGTLSSSVFAFQPEPVCNGEAFGRPTAIDCHAAYRAMADFSDPSAQYLRRLFVEPQLYNPPFRAVDDIFGHGIVQLPKIWTVGKVSSSLREACILKETTNYVGDCRVALVSYASADLTAITPVAQAWFNVITQAQKTHVMCVTTDQVGGYVGIDGK